jgi:plastocyanin
MRKHFVIALALAAAVLLIGGCGDDGSDSSDDGGNAVEAGAGPVNVQLRDFEFSPDDIQAEAGSTVTVELENTGSASHTFTTDTVDEELSPGDTATVEVEVPDGGVTFVCRFHEGQGMTGSIGPGGAGAGNQPVPETGGGGAPGY